MREKYAEMFWRPSCIEGMSKLGCKIEECKSCRNVAPCQVVSGATTDLSNLDVCAECIKEVLETEGAEIVGPVIETKTIEYDGFEIEVTRGKDGRVIISVDSTDFGNVGANTCDSDDDGVPQCRVWINDALIYSNGEVGDDLPLPDNFPNPADDSLKFPESTGV